MIVPVRPRVSVVTSSFNQGAYIERTIESVLAQHYPNLEHIVVDGMSTDGTQEVLARYRHLHVIREPDKGQADAINKGFRVATGEIFCFLNSDDTLLPGALDRVARDIDPTRGRHIVLGRCRFIDEHDRFLGVEHPSAFESHRRVLEIWKGYCVPQPAVFWTPDVWRRCGPLDEREQLMLDYDLFCRFSRVYRFHFVDQVLANYRMQPESKTSSVTDEQRLAQAIQVSRRYWGSPFSLQFWQVWLSHATFRFGRRRRALARLREAREAWRQARRPYAVGRALTGAFLGPDVATDVLVVPLLKSWWHGLVARAGALASAPRRLAPQSLAWRDYQALHPDGWAGPVLVTTITVEPGQTLCDVSGTTGGFLMPEPLELALALDGRPAGARQTVARGAFSVSLPLGAVAPGVHELKITANTFVIPHDYMGADDFRPLSYKLSSITLR